MRKLIFGAGIACMLGLSILALSAPACAQDEQLSQIAREAATELSKADYSAFFARFDDNMKSAMPSAKLPEVWGTITAQAGAFKSQGAIRQEKFDVYTIVFITCQFEKGPLDIKLVFNSKRQIAGLFFAPAPPPLSSAANQLTDKDSKEGLEGIWQGPLQTGILELNLAFKITRTEGGKYSGKMDSLDQGVRDIEVPVVLYDGSTVVLEIRNLAIAFEGTLKPGDKEIRGTFKQAGQSLPLVLKKTEKVEQLNRPQEPQKPYYYGEEEVTYESKEAGIKLAGTLTFPNSQPPFPAVLLISGSGAQNRNEEVMGHKPFLVLADYLTRRGIAVLRVDDRGVGGSSAGLPADTSESFSKDVLAGVEFLKSRNEINPRKIGLIGHSEGGLIAPMVASQSPDVAFIVLMAGPGVTGREILLEQVRLISRSVGIPEAQIDKNIETQKKIYQILDSNADAAAAESQIKQALSGIEGAPDGAMGMQIKTALSPWFRYFINYDPQLALRKLKCPVLAINGEKDLQVPPRQNLPAVEKALRASGNKDFKVVELPGLNHLFQTCKTGAVSEYRQIEETIAPAALQLMGDWILQHSR